MKHKHITPPLRGIQVSPVRALLTKTTEVCRYYSVSLDWVVFSPSNADFNLERWFSVLKLDLKKDHTLPSLHIAVIIFRVRGVPPVASKKWLLSRTLLQSIFRQFISWTVVLTVFNPPGSGCSRFSALFCRLMFPSYVKVKRVINFCSLRERLVLRGRFCFNLLSAERSALLSW